MDETVERIKDMFYNHRQNAELRRIPFLLSFEEWFEIWAKSGHLHERGNHADEYVMARFNDTGPYEIGNVKIIKQKENSAEVRRKPVNELTRPTTHWSIRLDATLAARVEMALWDPILRKPRYRSRKMLVEHLFEEWLKQVAQEEGQANG